MVSGSGAIEEPVVLIAFDPGETTGVCWMSEGGMTAVRTKVDVHMEQLQYCELRGHLAIWELLERLRPREIVSESFRLYASKATYKINSGFPEVEMIGVIRLWALINKVSLTEQPASLAKNGAPDEMLRRYGAYTSESRHVRDAIRHAIVFTRRKGAARNASTSGGRARKRPID